MGRSTEGAIVAAATVLVSLWSSTLISRIAYGRETFLGPKRCKIPLLDAVPEWLQWVSFCSFLVACGVMIWAVFSRMHPF